jgi:hypothetical protein
VPQPAARALALLCAVALSSGGCSSGKAEPEPTSRRVIYRVEDTAGATPAVTTVVIDRDGHYRGRVRTLQGAPPGGADLGGTAWDGERQYVLSGGRPTGVQDVAPGLTGADSNLDVSLASALAHDLVRRGATSTVADLPCDLWESKDPLDASSWALPTDTDHTTSCVSADGLLLSESWTLDGHLVRTRTAVYVGRGPSLAGTALLGGRSPGPLPTSPALEEVRRVDAAALAGSLGVPLPPPPIGFTLDRAASVLQRELAGQPSVEGGVFTYVAGERVVELRLERGLGGRTLGLPPDGVAVSLRDGRAARLTPGLLGLGVTFTGGHGLLATATADLREEALLLWVTTLQLG